jgi:hypothetical protein
VARPKVKIDLGELEKLCVLQCTDEEIAGFLGVSTRTLERRRKSRRFQEVMERGKAKGKISIRRNLYRLAGASAVAAIFLAKNHLGLKDVVANEHSGPEGAPIPISLADILRERIKNNEPR